jgi:hypothetical protein
MVEWVKGLNRLNGLNELNGLGCDKGSKMPVWYMKRPGNLFPGL